MHTKINKHNKTNTITYTETQWSTMCLHTELSTELYQAKNLRF